MDIIDLLIIDDSPAFNHLTKIALQKSGVKCNVTEMPNGQKALSYLEETARCPEVILLDINMPVMDGFDFLEEFSQSHKCLGKTLIYMLTSSSQEVDRERADGFGIVSGYFEKPLEKENITQILSDLALVQ